MDEEIYLDTEELHEYACRLTRQRARAQDLLDELQAMKAMADYRFQARYENLIRQVRELIEYYSLMSRTMEQVSEEAARLSLMARHQLEAMLAADRVRAILRTD